MDSSFLTITTHNSLILMATDCTHHQAEVQSIRWVSSLDKHLKGRLCILHSDIVLYCMILTPLEDTSKTHSLVWILRQLANDTKNS